LSCPRLVYRLHSTTLELHTVTSKKMTFKSSVLSNRRICIQFLRECNQFGDWSKMKTAEMRAELATYSLKRMLAAAQAIVESEGETFVREDFLDDADNDAATVKARGVKKPTSTKTKRDNFTDRQRAEIFVRDRATCAYSGKSLWALDFGAAPYSSPFIDHYTPCAKGGKADMDNGVCSSAQYNKDKRDKVSGIVLFWGGRPTEYYYTYHHALTAEMGQQLLRLSKLHVSDWQFNRAATNVLIGAALMGEKRGDGRPFTRNTRYWAGAAVKALQTWGKQAGDTTDFKSRGLVEDKPSIDKRLLLSMTPDSTVEEIERLIAELQPYVQDSWEALKTSTYLSMEDKEKAAITRGFLRAVKTDKYIVPQVKAAIAANFERFHRAT